MDVVEDVANQVGRQASAVLTVAAGELAKQASSIGQLANAKDPIAWLAGDEEEDADLADILQPPEVLVPVPLATLRPWGAAWGHHGSGASPGVDLFTPPPTAGPCAVQDGEAPRPPPFEADSGMNAKIHLWRGNLCALEVDALIAPCAANYTCGTSSVFPKVLKQGGEDLRSELRHLDQCRSGEARIVKSYGMPSFWLVVSVGPKYKEKYHIAAENTLNTCYRECMQLVVESDLRTVALPCIWYQKGYPPEEQAHVALRTMRKCLEKMRDKVDTVVFAASTQQEMELYESLLPRYFPRSAWESETGCKVLPDSCWNPWGEVTVEERRIKVSNLLLRREEELEEDDDRGGSLFDDADRSFLEARGDADASAMNRLQSTMTDAQDDYTARQICLRYLRKASTMSEESEISRFTYGAGVDRYGRKIIVLLGARFPALGVRDERTVPLVLKECEACGGNNFIIVYVNSGVEALDTVCLEVLQEMFSVVSAIYSSCLDQIVIIHPRLWFRAAFVVGRAISDQAVRAWQDMFYCETLFEVEQQFVSVQQLSLPDFVHHWDMQGPGAAGFL